jgi:hypothetical protein
MTEIPPSEVRVGAAIPAELHAEIQAIRAANSLTGDPEGGPSMSVCLRLALEMWVRAQGDKFHG